MGSYDREKSPFMVNVPELVPVQSPLHHTITPVSPLHSPSSLPSLLITKFFQLPDVVTPETIHVRAQAPPPPRAQPAVARGSRSPTHTCKRGERKPHKILQDNYRSPRQFSLPFQSISHPIIPLLFHPSYLFYLRPPSPTIFLSRLLSFAR